jgi:ADP-ribosylglycohydrolase
MVGDALGAAVEGWPQSEIRALAQHTWRSEYIEGFVEAVPMGTFVPAGEPGIYRPAREVKDHQFVPPGPPRNENTRKHCARFGMYTDDTNAALALASSIMDVGCVDAEHAARRNAEFFRDNELYRGCPPTAKLVQKASLDGVSADETGLPPYFGFPGGSFANGGAMRISPLAIAYRNADEECLRRAVEKAIRGTHRHPEALDFAVIQAAAVQYSLKSEVANFDTNALLENLASRCETDAMRRMICAIREKLASSPEHCDELEVVGQVVDSERRPGSGMGFQIASVHMAPCVLWAACRHFRDPCKAIKVAIDLAGDTDTTASMVGAIVGALHGETWCSEWASRLEDGRWGKTFALSLANGLASMDCA